ncbi:MAG: UDP-N-acetylglucosamine 2-epimerase [Candidatus Omnitrophica bacterium]|nr:UDP-N-acetylglucosamine 2-epimerase [Candidatus Omnitrophota bacterium]
MPKRRKIAIFTGNRAEYGLQYPIIKAISESRMLKYFLLVSGAHLDEKFGYTKKEIEKDGFKVYAEIKAEVKADSLFSTTQAIGNIIINLSRVLRRINPDFLVVYADRFEGLAAVVTGSQMGIPVAHVEGGDVTSGGALDDYVRHAMTKLSHIHFTTNQEAAQRIARLGEEKWRIFNVGFSVVDLIKSGKFASYAEVCEKIGFKLDLSKPVILFTQHSITTELKNISSQINPSLGALKYFAAKGVQIIITYPNNDAGGRRIIEILQRLGRKKIININIFPHLGRYYYHGLLNICGKETLGVCVGNSSSGIKETPALSCPFVNIGTRQKERLRSINVIDTRYDTNEIIHAINKSLFNKDFRESCRRCRNPYGEGGTGRKIEKVLASLAINKKLIQKKITY